MTSLRIKVIATLLVALTAVLCANPAIAARSSLEIVQLDQDYRSAGYILHWNDDLGVPDRILDAQIGRRYDTPVTGTPEMISQRFLEENATLLFLDRDVTFSGRGLNKGGGSFELRVVQVRESLSGTQVIRQQFSNGIPVEGATVQVNLSKTGEVLSAVNEIDPAAVILDINPSITSQDAIAATTAALPYVGPTRSDPQTELVAYSNAGRTVLAWKTSVALWVPFSDQVAYIDANTGETLSQSDRMLNCGKLPGDSSTPLAIRPPVAQPAPANPNFTKGSTAVGSGDVLPANPLNGHPERYALRDGDPVVGFVENHPLNRLDGSGFLRGDFVDANNSDQPRANEATLTYNYSPDVTDGPFHEVNVYWHLDEFQNYIQSALGIAAANNRQQPAYAHQGEDDNSSYSPLSGDIRYGDGGVDDSEDGEVILHEYGHAIHDDISGIGSGEAGAISEGFGDYLGATFGNNPIVAEWDATSYNPGPPPNLRRTDGTKHYPEDLVGQVHADGEIISSTWWDARNALGAVIADQLTIESFFLVGANATMSDMANAYVQADQAIYGGAHLGIIFSVWGNRGIGPAYLLEIGHTPLADTEDTAGPYAVQAAVAHTSPITGASAVQMHWRMSGDPTFTDVVMTSSGVDQWTASIPGPGVDATIEYYLSVTDDQAVSANLPATAPTTSFSFNVGTDFVPPSIVHTPLGDQPLLTWPAEVRAAVSDNLGLASVTCDWSLNGAPQPSFALLVAGAGDYAADFPVPSASLSIGDQIGYSITAVDASSASNSTLDGPHSFLIIDAKGVVLLIDDDGSAASGVAKQLPDKSTVNPGPARPDLSKGASGAQMAAALTAAGYVVTVETVAATNPATWSTYGFVISSSGANNSPLTDATYRSALVAYAQAGGKLVVEGGEVGYVSASSPGYADIVADVIHAFDWDADDSGPLIEVLGQELHPMRTTPNVLPAAIGVTYSGNFGDQDSVKPNADAYLVYGTTNDPANAGVLVYDDNPAPQSAQIVYMAFAMSQITDPAQGDALIENVADFLLASEGGANSSISGQVLVQNRSTHAGVTVTAGGVSTTTNHDGIYTISGLFASSYTVTASLAGWETTSQVVTVADGEALTGVNFELRQMLATQVCDQAAIAIPDNAPAGLVRTIDVASAGEIGDVNLSVDITHTWRGDLIVELTSPMGTTVRVHNRTGSSADNLVANYDGDTVPDGPGAMADFNGEDAIGTWTLTVSDNASLDTGTLNFWCIDLGIIQAGAVPVAVSNFSLSNVDQGIELQWETIDFGGITAFQVRRVVQGIDRVVNKKPITPESGTMRFVDFLEGVTVGADVGYVLEAHMKDNSWQRLTEVTSIAYSPSRPTQYALGQNSPNPFNPQTEIRFALVSGGHTTLRIYDVAGRLVRELVNEDLLPGTYTRAWRGLDRRGRSVSTGTYFYQLHSGTFTQTKSMVLVK
jgi:subtilisin-like proprotein convertase family protein